MIILLATKTSELGGVAQVVGQTHLVQLHCPLLQLHSEQGQLGEAQASLTMMVGSVIAIMFMRVDCEQATSVQLFARITHR